MVARLSESYTRLGGNTGTTAADGRISRVPHVASMGQRLLQRVVELERVGISNEGIPGIDGTPLYISDTTGSGNEECFIADSVFAVINQDGSICLRLPNTIAADLIENGLCVRAGKNLLTWPPESPHQLEVAWRILLHAYWNAAGTPARRSRRLWSEWVINH